MSEEAVKLLNKFCGSHIQWTSAHTFRLWDLEYLTDEGMETLVIEYDVKELG